MYFGETLPDAGYMADTKGIHRNTKEYNCIPGALTLYVSYLRIHTQYDQNTQEYIQNT